MGCLSNRMKQLLLIALLFAPLVSAADKKEKKVPNILIFMADDWSWPHAGALGDRTVKTPSFKRSRLT